jgi:hypothetical protein
MKRYIIAVTGLTKTDEKSFIEFIRENECNWWHRIENVWLIVDKSEKTSADRIRTFLKEISNSRVGFVDEIRSETWSGFAPKNTIEETFSWLYRNWHSD